MWRFLFDIFFDWLLTPPNKKAGYDPFSNPENRIEGWTDKDGQYNQKIVQGPDTGIHRFYDPENERSGQTGTIRPGR